MRLALLGCFYFYHNIFKKLLNLTIVIFLMKYFMHFPFKGARYGSSQFISRDLSQSLKLKNNLVSQIQNKN